MTSLIVKCVYSLTFGLAICHPKPLDLSCIDDQIDMLLTEEIYRSMETVVNKATEVCIIQTQGCCSWHGGIDHYDRDQRLFVCHDGTESKTCGKEYMDDKSNP